MILPAEALPLLQTFAPLFTRPTYRRFLLLLVAAVLATGRRTVANLLRTLGPLAPGHRTDYQRVLSRAPWSGVRLGCALAAFLLRRLVPEGPVVLVGDDTVDGHKGKRVYGKARHRDPVRSPHCYTTWRYGHRWIVLAVRVRLPVATRPWALPVRADLYGGGTRRVGAATGCGHWYKSGRGLVPIRWVFARDQSGTHRDEYFFTTDPSGRPGAVITPYTGRWNIETTFQERRAHLGLETTRGWCQQTVLRAAPCLFGLYWVVALLFDALPASGRPGSVAWPGKAGVTFSDALAAVRRWLWEAWIFPQAGADAGLQQIPEPLREILFSALAPAA
jgi:hypothetical protein